jgi:hypothetical protein
VAGLLGNGEWTVQGLLGRLPKPSEKEVAALRRMLDEIERRDSVQRLGLLSGPSKEELAELRQRRSIPTAEAPSPMVSIGRGAVDMWEPIKQTYLDWVDPSRAQTYRRQRAEDERLYQRGLLSANPHPNFAPKS